LSRIVVVSNDRIGIKMAGPAIRYYHFAHELAKRFDVTLVVPTAPDTEIDFADVVVAPQLSYRRFKQLVRRSDALVAQQLSAPAMRALAGGETKIIYDLYDPLLIETLPLFAARDGRKRQKDWIHEHVMLHQLLALSTGDAFLCASDRQRDLWLGLLTALGRVNIESYTADPTLRRLIDVVPFGLDPAPPRATRSVLKGVVPGIRETDKVLLWGGGIWDWFDPLTVIRAVAQIAETRDDVKLFFLGRAHPNPTTPSMSMPVRALELAEELGVEGSAVFFNDSWVDYDDRVNYLLEADVGVSSHFESAETRFAFRTRLLDYFWAGLPTLTTEGDVLAELVEQRGLGRSLPPNDVSAWVEAIEWAVDDGSVRQTTAENLASVQEELAWPRLAARVADIAEAPRVGRAVRPRASRELWTLLDGGALAARGVIRNGYDVLRPFQRPSVP
jgi:glycosyltransferase involved in cell wall biosynthesis